jgi:aminomethyltransferase
MTTALPALRRTALNALQRAAGARMADFHGWELPIQFSGILKEHEAVRKSCGVFDVSHMGQITLEGPQAGEFLQKVNSNDALRLAPGEAMYSQLLNERGGVVDDVIVSRLAELRWFVVVNAAAIEKDEAWLRRNAMGMDLELKNLSAVSSMLAVQGPQAHKVLADLIPNSVFLKRFGALEAPLYGAQAVVSRTGYTGEDGFEIVCPNELATRVWETVLARGASYGLLPCGLGARDTLRLEAGLLLYGSDIDDGHTPLEAGYGWVVKFSKKDFIGKDALLKQKAEGLRRKLLGVRLLERGVPRPGAEVFLGGERIGALCSATFSPTLQAGIGAGYFDRPDLLPGTAVSVGLHGRRFAAEISALPFYRSQNRSA